MPFVADATALRQYLPGAAKDLSQGNVMFVQEVFPAGQHQPRVFLETASARVVMQLTPARDLHHLSVTYMDVLAKRDRELLRAFKDRPPFSTFITQIIGIRMLHMAGRSLQRYFKKELHLEKQSTYPVASFLIMPQLPNGIRNYAYLALVNVVLSPKTGQPLGTYALNFPVPRSFAKGR